MAKTPTFKYTITAEIATSVQVKAKDLKAAVQNELSYVVLDAPNSVSGLAEVKIGKVTVVAQ